MAPPEVGVFPALPPLALVLYAQLTLHTLGRHAALQGLLRNVDHVAEKQEHSFDEF